MALKESGEMYLETIYVLNKKSDSVRSIDVCEYMGYSKPSVSRAVGLLKNNGFINVSKEGYLTLTKSGEETAKKLFERHTIISKFLMSLGVDEETATEDACRIEHVISDESFEAIKNRAGKSAEWWVQSAELRKPYGLIIIILNNKNYILSFLI